MVTAAQKQQAPLLSAYLIVGEDALKRDAVLKRLRKRVAQGGDLDFNHDVFSAEEAQGIDIISACDTMPFMSEIRLVEVTGADKLKKADAEALVNYLANPCQTTVLAVIAEKLAKNTRLYKALSGIGKQAVIDCAPKSKRDLPKVIRDMAVGHGVVFSDKAARKLLDLVGENTVALDAEVRKVALAHSGKDPVTDREVANLVAQTAQAKPWEFVDALSARNIGLALQTLERLDGTSSYALIGMCTRRVRELICARALMERGQGAQIPQALKMPEWRVKNHVSWARGFSRKELRDALVSARDAEKAMKSGADPDEAFLLWALRVMKHS